jgi:adenylate kinase
MHMHIRLATLFLLLVSALAGQGEVTGPFVLLIGPPGSGKSTQATQIGKGLGVPVVSVEQLIADNPEVFERIRRTTLSGMEPETDPVMNRLFQERLERGDLTGGLVLDGYPATKDHADFLAAMVRAGTLPRPLVVQLDIGDDVVFERTAGNPDISRESVAQRLKDYHREMGPLSLYFPAADIEVVNGMKKPKAVAKAINKILKKRFSK